MRTLVEQIWCDGCDDDADGEGRTLATHTHMITLDSPTPRRIDLCEKHYAALVTPLTALLDSHGVNPRSGKATKRVATAPKPKAPPVTVGFAPGNGPASLGHEQVICPVCERVFRGRDLPAHAGTHGVVISIPLDCPECAAAGTPWHGESPQGMAMHRYRRHSYDKIRDTLAQLRAIAEQTQAATA